MTRWGLIPLPTRRRMVLEIFREHDELDVNTLLYELRRRGVSGIDERRLAQWLRYYMEFKHIRKHRENGCYRWRLL